MLQNIVSSREKLRGSSKYEQRSQNGASDTDMIGTMRLSTAEDLPKLGALREHLKLYTTLVIMSRELVLGRPMT